MVASQSSEQISNSLYVLSIVSFGASLRFYWLGLYKIEKFSVAMSRLVVDFLLFIYSMVNLLCIYVIYSKAVNEPEELATTVILMVIIAFILNVSLLLPLRIFCGIIFKRTIS